MSRHLRHVAVAALALAACGSPTGSGTSGDALPTEDTVTPDSALERDGQDVEPDVIDAFDDIADTIADPHDLVDVQASPLPDRVLFRTATESFNRRYFVALRGGRIWVKPNTDVDPQVTGDWHLLGATGLPSGPDLVRSPAPEWVSEISADGIHLHALSVDGVLYRGDDLTNPFLVEGTFNWTDRWGWPAAQGPGLTMEWPTRGGWSVSDSHPLGVARYQDRDGTTHDVGMGVAHVYRLGPEGRRIHFNDWWLPADWSRQICGPERGTFTAERLSASASTLFVIDAAGALYTRLYDLDTAGENTLLTYSYVIDGPSGTTRKLPAEDWRRQPAPGGVVTDRITIFQSGQGNAARVLRVEGERDGVTGYFEKPIDDDAWAFLPTNAPLLGRVLGGASPSPPTPDDHRLVGTLSRSGEAVTLEVPDFNLFCSPARARLIVDGQPVTVDGAPLELAFHHVHLMVTEVRATSYWRDGEPSSIRAALLVPQDLDAIDDTTARDRVRGLLGGERVINLTGTATRDHVALDEIPWTTPFLVPGDEKAFGPAFALTLEAEALTPPVIP